MSPPAPVCWDGSMALKVWLLGETNGEPRWAFPLLIQTAPQTTLPGDGVYATWITIDGERRSSATSIGIRPHFGLSERLVEVFVLDFTADLYGQRLNLEFVHKLRDQQSFSSLEELIGQIDVDVAGARAILDQDRKANGA